MNDQNAEPNPESPADTALRKLLAQADPAPGGQSAPAVLLERIRVEAASDTSDTLADRRAITARTQTWADRSFGRRHWAGLLMAAAAFVSIALAAGSIRPLGGGGGGDASLPDMAAGSAEAAGGAIAAADTSAAVTPTSLESAAKTADTQYLDRSASLLIGATDLQAARDSFVKTVKELGGRVTDESTVSSGGGTGPLPADTSSSLPWTPSGPSIWIAVQVPAKAYEQAVAAARGLGVAVREQQSSADVTTQVTDVNARVAALESSLARLSALMDQAKSVSDVIKVESAVSDRQAELDSLKAQQRDLADRTQMSRIDLTLMSPADARAVIDPTPQRTWWESLLAGLAQLWTWLGKSLLICSPLLLAGAVIWWVRRRRPAGGATDRGNPEA
ncbi:MAG: DUF4349 domain-containing protein [Candidatus Nanopelagicales bacterium]